MSLDEVGEMMLISIQNVLVMACCKVFGQIFSMERPQVLTAPVVLAVLSGSILIAPDYFDLEWFSESILQPLNVGICYIFIPVIWIILKIREKKGRKGIDNRGDSVVN